MSQTVKAADPKTRNANRVVAMTCVGVFFGMIGVSYAAVPQIGRAHV